MRSLRWVLFVLVLAMAAPATALAQDACLTSHGPAIASWCGGPLEVSADDGATWHPVASRAIDAAIASDGTVYFLASSDPEVIGVGPSGGRWSVPFDFVNQIEIAGDVLYVHGWRQGTPPDDLADFVVRRRIGATRWDELGPVSGAHATSSLRVEARRGGRDRITVLASYGLSCFGLVRVRRFVREGERFVAATLLDAQPCADRGVRCAWLDTVWPGAHGTAYAVSTDGPRPGALFEVRAGSRYRHVATGAGSAQELLVADNTRITLAVLGTRLYVLRGARATLLDAGVPDDPYALHVDGRGRAWIAAAAGLFRFSRVTGWQRLR